MSLDQDYDNENSLNIFSFDADFEANERKYLEIKQEIMGIDSDDADDSSASSEEESGIIRFFKVQD